MKTSRFISKLWLLAIATLFSVTSSHALKIDIQSGKEKGSTYSSIHIQDQKAYICESIKDDFFVTKEVLCYFDHAPIHNFSNVSNPFFDMYAYETPKLYIVSIKPKHKMKLMPIADDIAMYKRIIHHDTRKSRHWFIIGYKESLPLFEQREIPVNGLSFPIDFAITTLPSVGALGLNGHPIDTNHISEVSDYMEIRRYYDRGQYDQVFNTITKALEKDPNSIFKSEFILYQIRTKLALDELADAIDLCKDFLREFSSNEAVPEVLLYLAQASSKMGLLIDAEYFYDRLLSEHYDSIEATKGLISLGTHTSSKGDSEKAIGYYNQALEKAETKEIASDAAFKIANFYLAKGKSKKAAFYIQKIATGNIEYLLEDYGRTYDIAKEFSDHEAYIEAADLMLEVLNTLDKSDRRYEGLLYQISVWYDLGNSNEKAYELYKKYAKEFEYGEYLSEIEERIDKVLFEIGDSNVTKQLALYDTIAKKYQKEEISSRARYLKAELLYKEKEYDAVLKMEKSLRALNSEVYPNAKSLIVKSAQDLATKSLEAKECDRAITLLRRYDFNMTQTYSAPLYKCTMDVSDFKAAVKLSEPFIYDKDMDKRLTWLYRYVKASAKVGDSKVVFVMGMDLISLLSIEERKNFSDIKIDIFKAALDLNEEEKAIELITDIETSLGLRYSEIELYYLMSKLAKKRADNTMIENYASKVIKLQEDSKSYTFTPGIELQMLNALKKLNKDNDAYDLAKVLVTHVSTPEDKARAYYELGMICQRLNYQDQMQKAFTKSSEASENSPWSKLSKDALDLL
jgi:tetratricopeptide (TPR) repeat protein